MACLPLDVLVGNVSNDQGTRAFFASLDMVKIIRIARMERLIRYLNVKHHVKMYLRLARLFFFMILYIHVHSCLWFVVASHSEVWVPPYTSLTLGPTPDSPLFYSNSHSYQYSYTLYHGVLMLAGNDIYPQT